MKYVICALLIAGHISVAADTSLSPVAAGITNATRLELQAIVKRVQVKLKDRKQTPEDLADELKEYDALLAKHRGEKTTMSPRFCS